MQTLAVVGLLVFLFATASIGLRLLGLWRKTRQLPELTVGISYLFGGTPALVTAMNAFKTS